MSLNIWDQEAIMVKNTSNKENRMGTPLGTGSCCPKKFNCQKSDYSNSFYRQAEGFTSKAMKHV